MHSRLRSERKICLRYLKSNGKEIHGILSKPHSLPYRVLPSFHCKDILGLGSKARMNLPASQEGNWLWRYKEGALNRRPRSALKRTH